MWDFAMAHPVAAFFIIWIVGFLALGFYRATMRAIVVSVRGWPPRGLDADGDYPLGSDGK